MISTRNSSRIAIGLAIVAAACADPPVDLPNSSPFPYNVQLGMTFQNLRLARPGIWLEPDSGWVLEEHPRGRFQYEFTGTRWPPARQSRLIYVHRVDDELSGDDAADRWDTLADSMAVELNAEPGCASIDYGRLVWRRAMFREAGGQLEAAVELQITTIGDAGPGLATLITRVWLAEFAAPVAHFLDAPRTTARGPLPDWAPCEEPVASVPADVADQPYPGFTISSRTTVGAGWTSVASSPLAADSGLSQSCFLQPWRPRTRLSRMVFHDNAQGLVMLSLQGFAPRLLLATAVAISAVACDQPPPEAEAARVTVWDSAGVEIVENHAPESGDSAFWSVDPEPALVIGGSTVVDSPDDPSQLVWEVQGLARLSDGRVLVHSGGEEAVFLFEPTGELVTRIGRKGQGPGEFVRPQHIQVLPGDTIVVWDYGFTRVNYFDPMGTFVGARQLDVATVLANTRTATEYAPENIRIPLPDGSFIVQRGLNDQAPPAPGEIQRRPVEYLRIDTDYSVHSFGWWRWREGLGTTTMLSYPWPPFPVYPRVAAGGDPLSVHVADGGWYGIHQFVPDGTLRRIIRRETVPVPITPEELSEWKRSARDRYPGFGWPESDFGWPEWERALAAAPPREFHPAIRWLVVDTEGFLWVWGPGDSGADVFDHGGRWLGSVEGVPAGVRWIDEELILVALADPDTDVQRIEGYRLRRD